MHGSFVGGPVHLPVEDLWVAPFAFFADVVMEWWLVMTGIVYMGSAIGMDNVFANLEGYDAGREEGRQV